MYLVGIFLFELPNLWAVNKSGNAYIPLANVRFAMGGFENYLWEVVFVG
jgi:hypothetical protein